MRENGSSQSIMGSIRWCRGKGNSYDDWATGNGKWCGSTFWPRRYLSCEQLAYMACTHDHQRRWVIL